MAASKSKIRQLIKRFLILAVAAFCLLECYYIGRVLYYARADVTTSAYIERERDRLGKVSVKFVPLSQVSNSMVRAVVASEDAQFMFHDGVDWTALKSAALMHVNKGKTIGASTITQQVVKNLFLTHRKSYIRKAQEIVLALVMDATWSKGRILQTYLNIAEFGEGIFGVQAAARHYFGKSASALTYDESLWLAAVLNRPRFHQRYPQNRVLMQRIHRIDLYMDSAEVSRVNNRMK